MQVISLTNSFFASASHVIQLADAIYIVDPGDSKPLIDAVERIGLRVAGILLTHAHFDHIYGLNELIERFPDAPIYTNEAGAEMLVSAKLNLSKYHEQPFELNYPQNIVKVADGDTIGNIQVVATPGHNPSCLTYIIDDAIFTGDAYIPGIAVVTNLPKGNKALAQQSMQHILSLSDGKKIYPGHIV